ncbi:hypothetical protein ACJJTC_007374 [Scirpophaga incertulas]
MDDKMNPSIKNLGYVRNANAGSSEVNANTPLPGKPANDDISSVVIEYVTKRPKRAMDRILREDYNQQTVDNVKPELRTHDCYVTEDRLQDDIQHIRIAKLKKDNDRPRAVVAKLCDVRQRDILLVAVMKFDKIKERQDKLNSCHLGYAGVATSVYVTEHLSPF